MFNKPSTKSGVRQRKQTLTGLERKGGDLTYYSQRNDQYANTGRGQSRPPITGRPNKIRNYWIQRFGFLIFIIVLFVSVIYVFSLSSNAKVVPLQSTNVGFLHSQATYQTAASKLLASSIWNRNKLTINTESITKQLMAQFPELSAASVTLPILTHRPIIYISPAQPALLLVGSNGAYVLDTSGRALMVVNNPKDLLNLTLPLVTDQSGLKLAINQQALSSTDVEFIVTVVAQLAAKQVVVSSLTLPVATRELDVGIATQSYIVKFNLQDGDARQQAGTFLATRARLSSQNITPAHYIDVRVSGRAYYQ